MGYAGIMSRCYFCNRNQHDDNMDNSIDIPPVLYADEAVLYIANRHGMTSEEFLHSFVGQEAVIGRPQDINVASPVVYEDNEIEILRDLLTMYSSESI